jgi:hypothetical protein
MRDSGYRSTAYALAELIDNSVQASANMVEVLCLEERAQLAQRQRRRINKIAVLDNGTGMTPAVLRSSLQFGNGTHLNDREGIGRFGMGLPNASISQGKRVDVWTWQSGPDNAIYSYLDVDEVESGRMRLVPKPKAEPVPAEWRSRGKSFGTTGTLVLWSKFEDERQTWKGARSTLEHTEALIGRMYRKFIHHGDLQVRLCALGGTNVLFEKNARVNDPLYLLSPSSTPAPFDTKPMFQKWGEEDQYFDINFRGEKHKVWVRASWATRATLPPDGTDRGSKEYGKHAAKNIGLSIVRAGRELDLDPSWTISDPTERWWGIEVEFPPALDEIFGVTNNKQAATIFSHMVSFDWKSEAENGEEYTDYKRRLNEEGDPRSDLIEIVNYIKTILLKIRSALADQTKGRRSPGKRHDETSVEDRATTKFKERATTGHGTAEDREVFDDKAKTDLVANLVKEKNYSEPAAEDIADAVQRRDRKVIFVEAASEMDAFFAVELRPGGVTEIVFNRSHPAYQYLLNTLDSDTTNATDRDLISRIENASDTIKMLFAAWARQEIEDMPGREKLRRMRQDWGRMARDFLTDEKED